MLIMMFLDLSGCKHKQALLSELLLHVFNNRKVSVPHSVHNAPVPLSLLLRGTNKNQHRVTLSHVVVKWECR